MSPGISTGAYDRVIERRRALALAHHFREAEGLWVKQIAGRRGRSPATVKAYFYDPSDANKRPTNSLHAKRLGWLSSTSGRLGVLMLDRVTERRRAAQLARHYRDQEGLSIAEIARRLGRAEATIKAISTIQPAIRHARSRRATGECVAAAGRPPRHGTARATPTRIANAAIPARSRRNGHGNGFAKRCAHGERATALRRPRMTGRARTHAGAAAKRSNDYRPENGPHRPLSSICTGPGRRPSPTPSPAPERRATMPLTHGPSLALGHL